jgi:hypothetical protein
MVRKFRTINRGERDGGSGERPKCRGTGQEGTAADS